LILQSELRRRAASRRALSCPSSYMDFTSGDDVKVKLKVKGE